MERYEQLKHWLSEHLAIKDFAIEPASSDASFRRYFRVTHNGQSLIVMDAPPPQEDTEPFIKIATLLTDIGLNAPIIKEVDKDRGYLLISDLGNRQYLDELNNENVDRLYEDALQALLTLQKRGPCKPGQLPAYDHDLLKQEMELFRTWYLKEHLTKKLSPSDEKMFDETFAILAQSALAQPQVCVHRDYHSRNLMLTNDNNPGILDFQDAVIGPITYDLVSLLRDCYIRWPIPKVESWALGYEKRLVQANLIDDSDEPQFLKWFDWMGVQRHLKASGIFARLNHRDNKPDYLNDIPRTMSYVIDVCQRYTELKPLYDFLQSHLPTPVVNYNPLAQGERKGSIE